MSTYTYVTNDTSNQYSFRPSLGPSDTKPKYAYKNSNISVDSDNYQELSSQYNDYNQDFVPSHDQMKIFDDYNQSSRRRKIRWKVSEVHHAIDQLAQHQLMTYQQAKERDNLHKSLQVVQQAAAMLYPTPHYKPIINDYLLTKHPVTIEPGTIGQFLFGNIAVDYRLDISTYCTPSGVGALPRKDDESSHDPPACPRQVWYYKSGRYHRLTPPHQKSNHCDLYVPLDFWGLSESEISRFTQHEIEKVHLFTMVKDHQSSKQIIIERSDLMPLLDCRKGSIEGHMKDSDQNESDLVISYSVLDSSNQTSEPSNRPSEPGNRPSDYSNQTSEPSNRASNFNKSSQSSDKKLEKNQGCTNSIFNKYKMTTSDILTVILIVALILLIVGVIIYLFFHSYLSPTPNKEP